MQQATSLTVLIKPGVHGSTVQNGVERADQQSSKISEDKEEVLREDTASKHMI
jgi:hypothetical protein